MIDKYLRLGSRVFEIVAEDFVRNFGLGSSIIREIALRDIVTEDVRFVTGGSLVAYGTVGHDDAD